MSLSLCFYNIIIGYKNEYATEYDEYDEYDE